EEIPPITKRAAVSGVEGRCHIVPNLVPASARGGADVEMKVARRRSMLRSKHRERRPGDVLRGASPTGMHPGHNVVCGVVDEHRNAVGDADRKEPPRLAGNERIALTGLIAGADAAHRDRKSVV